MQCHARAGAVTDPPLSVRRFHEGGYMVRSQRPSCGEWYLVTLDHPDFPHGHCHCIHFACRIEPRVVRHQEPEWPDCVHIRRVRSTLEHAQALCEAAGIEFSERIIPMFGAEA